MTVTRNAIGLLELSSIAMGFFATDVMLKTADVKLILSRTVCPGKFITLIWGEVSAIQASMETGIKASQGYIVNDLIIPNLDEQVFPAMTATNPVKEKGALGIHETFDIVSSIIAADAAVKAAIVTLVEIRVAMAIGGKAFYMVTGDVSAVEASIKAGLEAIEGKGQTVYWVVIPRPRDELFQEFV